MNHLSQCNRRGEPSINLVRGFGGWRFFSVGLLLLAVLIGSACGKAPVKPSAIGPDDVCFYFKSPIDEKQVIFAAEFITNTGFVRKFDDISCLIANAKKVGKKNIQAFYAADVTSGTLLPAEELQFVRSDKIRTPKNGGIVAYKDAAQAQRVAARYQGELVKIDDLIK